MSSDKEVVISKSVLPSLPEGYEETHLGARDGAIRQYRSRSGVHVREYVDRFVVHQDRFDPKRDPLLHLAVDSPETLFALGSATLISRTVGKCSVARESKPTSFPINPLLFFLSFFSLDSVFRSLKRILFW
ncbi:MAG: hypothetical protein ACRECH_05830 [Nitrososphaerales archaeon]